MQEWWMSLDLFLKSLWCISITTSLIFIIQTVLTFIGMDSDAGSGADFDGSTGTDGDFPFQLFTFRNFINFFLGFSWTAIAFYEVITPTWFLLFIAILGGLLLVAAVLYIFYLMSRMEQSGNINIDNALGCRGNVYLKIPAKRSGEGKKQISIQGAIREYDALTDGEELPTGSPIRVIEVLNAETLLVEKI